MNDKQILDMIKRKNYLFTKDIKKHETELKTEISKSRFLVIGGAGTIGLAVTKEIFFRNPQKLHVVDISENNLVELVRDIRSSFGYINGDFKTLALDVGSVEFDSFWKNDGEYDYVLNLSALKHVRSEKDPFTLMRMIEVNILNTIKTIERCIENEVKKYFCVSTDKAANPVNMMGASKRIMEMYANKYSEKIDISMARFANVAFSDGSLLHSFENRISKKQPIVAPNDVRRYFVTKKESGELCLMSCLFGENRDIFFPKLNENLHLITFSEIAEKYLKQRNYEAYLCENEKQARELVGILPNEGKWPCLFSSSDTTGEKDYEEFFTENENLDLDRFDNLGIIKNKLNYNEQFLDHFLNKIQEYRINLSWSKKELVALFNTMLPNFNHIERNKNLDAKM